MINQVSNANAYLDGNNLLGRLEEITLPDIKFKNTEHKGLGMSAEIEVPTGILEKLEAKYKFGSIYPESIRDLADPRASRRITVRSTIKRYTGQGLEAEVPLLVELGGPIQGLPVGAFKKGEGPQPEVTQTVWYYRLVADGQELWEIDVMANIHRVAGQDILAEFRNLIGA